MTETRKARKGKFQDALSGIGTGSVAEISLEGRDNGWQKIKELAGALRSNGSVTSLRLLRCPLGLKGAKALADVLQDSSIAKLHLTENSIGSDGTQVLAAKLSGVTDLVLAGNSIGDKGAQFLAAVLERCSLRRLSLCGNSIGLEGSRALADVLERTRVTSLDLSSNNLRNGGTQVLAEALLSSSIVHLNLSSNSIALDGIRALAAGLRSSGVKTLDLSCNQIGTAGSQVLADALTGTSLSNLDLSSNSIGDKGLRALAQGLRESSVMVLRVAANSIEDLGVQASAPCLRGSSVGSIDLGSNNFGDLGGEALIEGLRDTIITTLCLANTRCSPTTLNQLHEVLEANEARKPVFVLQLEVKGEGPNVELSFRTLSGRVAAVLSWNTDEPIQSIPEAVWGAMSATGFQPPFEGLHARLKMVLPNGGVLDAGPTAKSLAEQLRNGS